MREFINFYATFNRKIEIIVWILNKSQTQLHKGVRLNVKNTNENEHDSNNHH